MSRVEHMPRESAQTREFEEFTQNRGPGIIRRHERSGCIRAREQPLSPAATPAFLEKHR